MLFNYTITCYIAIIGKGLELDRLIVEVNLLAYPMFPSTFDKHEPALLLLNQLPEKKISLIAVANSSVENDDSG